MLLEKKSSSEAESGSYVEDVNLGNLVSSLNTLSLDVSPQKDVVNLECVLSKVTLHDSKHILEPEVEKDISKCEELTKKKENKCQEKKLVSLDEKVPLEEEEDTEGREIAEVPKQSKSEETESTSSEGEETLSLNVNLVDSKDKNVEQDENKEIKEEGKNEEEKDVSDSNNESSSDEATAPLATKKKGKKLLSRGFGTGEQTDQHYQYGRYPPGYTNFQCGQPAVAPIAYASQPIMSPQHAMSPGYSNMAMSPIPGYTEPSFNAVQSGNGFIDGMCPVLGSSSIGFDPDWTPETPPSPNRGENDFIIPQGFSLADATSQFPTQDLDEILPKACNFSNGDVPQNELIPILDELLDAGNFQSLGSSVTFPNGGAPEDKLLLEQIIFNENPQMQNLMLGRNADWQNESDVMSPGQDCYRYPLSPPTEEDSQGISAEVMVMQKLDEELYGKARKRIARIKDEDLTAKDDDGDNPCVVVACQDDNVPRFYENLVAMVERACSIDICCEKPVSKEKGCTSCGNNDRSTFYTPFSMVNNEVLQTRFSVYTQNSFSALKDECDSGSEEEVDPDKSDSQQDNLNTPSSINNQISNRLQNSDETTASFPTTPNNATTGTNQNKILPNTNNQPGKELQYDEEDIEPISTTPNNTTTVSNYH
ncbi:hypothetical protein SK128_012031 [Halocaridina rubra]|uniref:Uncharacterized protein n=1 Tax=Halocaridina rubra TaxID=373956 RepID=A0AAN8WMZ0_HALRR